MFDFHIADAIASSLLINAMCSIGAHPVLEYSVINPAWALSRLSSQMTSEFLPTTCQK